MEMLWRPAISRRYGSLLDGMEQAIRGCPDDLWEESVWEVKKDHAYVWPPHRTSTKVETPEDQERLLQVYSAFWNVTYHTLFHVDFYLSGGGLPFKAPPPFREPDHRAFTIPDRVFTKAELLGYVDYNRKKYRDVLDNLSDEEASRLLPRAGQSFAELVVHNLVHAYEHLAQLQLFLGQRAGEAGQASPAQMLRDRVRQRSDDEIDVFVVSIGGYDRLLPMVFAGVCGSIGKQGSGKVGFDVGKGYTITMSEKGAKFVKGIGKSVDGTLAMSQQDYLRMVTSELDFGAALADGRIRIGGDEALVMGMFAAMARNRG